MKEVENYLLVATAIRRCIIAAVPQSKQVPSLNDIQEKTCELAEQFRNEAFDGFAQEFLAHDRSLGIAGANRKAREHLNGRVQEDGLMAVVSGKKVVSALSAWAQKGWGVSVSARALARSLKPDEVSEEIRHVLHCIEGNAA